MKDKKINSMKIITKEEFELIDNHTNEEREPYIGMACFWCPSPAHQICPSCRWRYTKLALINEKLDLE